MHPKLEYGALNQPVFESIPHSARRILDLGCGTGSLGRAIKARQAAEVVGVTYSGSEAESARSFLDHVIVADLNSFTADNLGKFDCLVCSHVLEHLYWPDQVLRAVAPAIAPDGRLIVALPNLLVWKQRLRLLRGKFRYTDGGLMDRTHFRFFDWGSARALLADAGLREISAFASGGVPLSRFMPGLGSYLDHGALRLSPGLFGTQFVIIAAPKL